MYVTDIPVHERLTNPAVEALIKEAKFSTRHNGQQAAREALEALSGARTGR